MSRIGSSTGPLPMRIAIGWEFLHGAPRFLNIQRIPVVRWDLGVIRRKLNRCFEEVGVRAVKPGSITGFLHSTAITVVVVVDVRVLVKGVVIVIVEVQVAAVGIIVGGYHSFSLIRITARVACRRPAAF